mgnify:FL=1
MSRFEVAMTGRAKLAGLFAYAPDGDVVLMLAGCCDIHTCGMRSPIDAAFVDAQGTVIESLRGILPWRRFRRPGAAAVLERYSVFGDPWPAKGSCVGEMYPKAAEILESMGKDRSLLRREEPSWEKMR